MASLTDKLTDTRNAARPNSARVNSPRTAGAGTLVCDNLTGWPTASKVHFVTYKIDSSSAVVAGTQLDCYGIVSGNSITSFTVVDGTDVGHAVNDIVEMLPTAAWGQDLADGLNVQHNRTGTHKSITTDTISTTGNATVGGNETVGGTMAVTGASTLTGAVGGAGYSVATISNPYKFRVYLNANQSVSANTFTKVLLDTKATAPTSTTMGSFDTGGNFDIVTNHRFTAPINGFYFFSGHASSETSNVRIICSLYKNGVEASRGSDYQGNGSTVAGSVVSDCIQLLAGDFIELWAFNSGTVLSSFTNDPSSYAFLSGFLVSAT